MACTASCNESDNMVFDHGPQPYRDSCVAIAKGASTTATRGVQKKGHISGQPSGKREKDFCGRMPGIRPLSLCEGEAAAPTQGSNRKSAGQGGAGCASLGKSRPLRVIGQAEGRRGHKDGGVGGGVDVHGVITTCGYRCTPGRQAFFLEIWSLSCRRA